MDEKTVLALIERIDVKSSQGKVESVLAKIDTGADNSSIDHSIAAKLELGPIVKTKKIVSSHGQSLRPVIKVTVVIAGKPITEHFTLYNRSHMKYPILIGKNVLRKGFLIDPSLPEAD